MAKKAKIPAKLLKYLEKAGVRHDILEHRTVYTAIDAANTMKKKVDEIVKSLLVKADKDYFLVLLPASHNVDFDKLKNAIGKLQSKEIKIVKIPGEKIVENALKIKAETLTAFGRVHNLAVIMDKNLAKLKKAVFSAGSTNHSIEMAVKDFIKMESADLATFSKKKIIKKQATIKPKRKRGVKRSAVKKGKK